MIVLITGGSSGIGKNLADAYLSRGHQVIVVSENAEKLEATRIELSRTGNAVSAVPCDVSDAEDARRMVATVLAKYGCPDVVVNNAGFAVYRSFDQSTMEEIERLIA